jgi:hypothetical protein
MALRRLLSGWLIAMAALARSVAQALEHASEDRSAPALDPAMAALAERYPGAPAHWLAHVAERTSQLAEAGEAPFSLDSDPAAWPTLRSDGPAPRPLGDEAPVSNVARRAEAASPHASEVPSLAVLRDRPSEVWRRPDVEPRRRPRPVFATATLPERPARPATEFGAAPARPRARLTVVSARSQPLPNASEPTTPTSAAPATDTVVRTTAWSESPSSEATSTASEASSSPRVEGKALRREQAFAQTRLTPMKAMSEEPPETDLGPAARPPSARRQRSWFFARSRFARSGRSLDLATDPRRKSEEGRANPEERGVAAPPPRPAFPFLSPDRQAAERPVEPEQTWRAPPPPAARRALFQALAALRTKPRLDRHASEASTASKSAIDAEPRVRPSPERGRGRPSLGLTSSSKALTTSAAPTFNPLEESQSPHPVEKVRQAGIRRIHRPSSLSASTAEMRGEDNHTAFSAPRSLGPRAAARRFVDAPSDERWPALPPTTLTAPPGVEAASPRWDQLAREQEEGRWSV